MKKLFQTAAALLVVGTSLAACQQPADVASRNLSKAADNFEVVRKVVFYNSITDTDLAVIEGLCSLGNQDTAGKLSVTCKVAEGLYKKHFLGLSDNVTFFALQMDGVDVSTFRHRIVWRPQSLIFDADIQYDGSELTKERH